MRLQAACQDLEMITGSPYPQVRRGGGQGRGRTADLPLFSEQRLPMLTRNDVPQQAGVGAY